MARWTAPLAASLLLAAFLPLPAASAGPCDNEVERILCALLAPIEDPPTPCDPMLLDSLCTIWTALLRFLQTVCEALTTGCPLAGASAAPLP